MGIHDSYGKRVLHAAAEGAYCDIGPECRVDLGAGPGAAIDGI
jgi:hypothetical protein